MFVDMPNGQDPDATGSPASALFALALNSWVNVSNYVGQRGLCSLASSEQTLPEPNSNSTPSSNFVFHKYTVALN